MSQISLTFPDGAKRAVQAGTTGLDVAKSIAPSLAKRSVAMSLNGKLADLAAPIKADAAIKFLTREDKEALELIRHDAAHVMAQAVQELYPGTQVTIGPVIENGFYYDFARDEPFTPEDLPKIEAKMREIIARDAPFSCEVVDRKAAKKLFADKGETFKLELIDAIPEGDEIKIYSQREWFDLCRGPHMTSTGKVGKGFKLLKIAGAYWRGDSTRPMLQRIYGTAWASEDDLKAYLHQLEEAEKRDHRRLGREMDLFHFQEEAPGAVFWHPKGWALFTALIAYMRRRQNAWGYVEVNSPDMMERKLWELSGHWEKFGENMYIAETPDERIYCCKPMNCPGHVQIFKHGLKSYRDLPLRIAEFGKVHRYEPSGALHGLLRVRHFTQDDAHIFCTEDQITEECVQAQRADAVDLSRFRLHRCAHQILRPAGQARRRRRGLGQGRGRVEARGGGGRARLMSSIRARAPSTGRSSNMCCATQSAATGNAARSRSISTCRCGSAPSISGPTARRPCR